MKPPILRPLRPDEWETAAEITCAAVRDWYKAKLGMDRFGGGPATAMLFPRTYEAMDPGCCLVAEDAQSGRIMACCYYHPRETHVSLGIMNVHPDFFGRGLAKHLLAWILDFAKAQGKPVRLVSSALNLDSFSLYTRAGFVPVRAYQTMNLAVPDEGFAPAAEIGGAVREARPQDAKAMADLEMELCGIRRESDFAFFIENRQGIWGCSVLVGEGGAIDGFLASVNDPGSNMLGPGVARTAGGAAALIAAELDRRHRGLCPTFLAPADCPALIQTLYGWGARNSEIHFAQVWGQCPPMRGVNLPTFMPETG